MEKCKFGLFLFCGEPDFLVVNSCLKDCLPPQSSLQWKHKVSLLGTHVCISFEQEHFAPVDGLLFNCSQLFSFLFFCFPLLNCKDFQDNDGFCPFLPLLLYLMLVYMAMFLNESCAGVAWYSPPLSDILVLRLRRIISFCSFLCFGSQKQREAVEIIIIFLWIWAHPKNVFPLILAHNLVMSPEEI